MDPLAIAGQFVSSLLSGNNLPPGGASPMGDFDLDSFLNANMSQAMHTKGTDLPKITQGIAQALGVKPAFDATDQAQRNSEGDPLSQLTQPLSVQPSQDFMDSMGPIIEALSVAPPKKGKK